MAPEQPVSRARRRDAPKHLRTEKSWVLWRPGLTAADYFTRTYGGTTRPWVAAAIAGPIVLVAVALLLPVSALVMLLVGAAWVAALAPAIYRRKHEADTAREDFWTLVAHARSAESSGGEPLVLLQETFEDNGFHEGQQFASRELADSMAKALEQLHASRAAREGWLDQALLRQAHVATWQALIRLNGLRELRRTLREASEHAELADVVRDRREQLRTAEQQVLGVGAALTHAAEQTAELDRKLDQAEQDRRRARRQEQLRAELGQGMGAPVPSQELTAADPEAVAAITARVRAARELLG